MNKEWVLVSSKPGYDLFRSGKLIAKGMTAQEADEMCMRLIGSKLITTPFPPVEQ